MKKYVSRELLISQGISGLIGLISVSFTARYVGPEVFGFCSVVVLLLVIGTSLSDFGACSWAARELAANNISKYFFKLIMLKKSNLNYFFLIFALPIYQITPDNLKYSAILTIYPYLWNRYNYVQQFLLTIQRVRISILLLFVDRGSWLLIIPFQFLGLDPVLAFSLPLLTGLILHDTVSRKIIWNQVVQSQTENLSGFSSTRSKSRNFGKIGLLGVVGNLDGLLVGALTNISESGNYLVSQRFRSPLALVYYSIGVRLKVIAAKRDKNILKMEMRKDLSLFSLGIFVNIQIAIFSYFFSGLLVGSDFIDISLSLFFGTLTAIPLGISYLASGLISAMGEDAFAARAQGVYVFSLLSFICLGANLLGSQGAVITSFAANSIYALCLSLKLRSTLKFDPV